jgi:hypothetical protein
VTVASGRSVRLGVDRVSRQPRCPRAVVLGVMRGGSAVSGSVGGGLASWVGVAAAVGWLTAFCLPFGDLCDQCQWAVGQVGVDWPLRWSQRPTGTVYELRERERVWQ